MRKVWLGIVGAVVVLGLGLAVAAWGISTTSDRDSMGGNNMGTNNMSTNKMADNNMSTNKMADNNMSGNNMAGDKMDKK
jgi:pentapeptide MXKDX repeat protein